MAPRSSPARIRCSGWAAVFGQRLGLAASVDLALLRAGLFVRW